MTTVTARSLPALTGLRLGSTSPRYGASEWLCHRAHLTPGREALLDAGTGRCLTYRQLADRSEALATALRHQYGLRRYDRVATLTLNCVEWVELFFATARIGALLVPLNWRLAPLELEYQLRDSQARILFTGAEHLPLAAQLSRNGLALDASIEIAGAAYEAMATGAPGLPPLGEEEQAAFSDPHLVLYTSGTTGKPKGAVLTHANTFWNAVNVGISFGLTESDTTITFLPMFHSGGVGLFTIPTLHAGGRCVVMRTFEPSRAVDLVQRERVSRLFGVPATWLELLTVEAFTAAECPSLRSLGSGGAPCPMAVIERMAARGFALQQGYGLTETAPGGTLIPREDWQRKAGSVGKAMPHVALRVVDDSGRDVPVGAIGEVWFRGPNVFAGYWNLPDATDDAFSSDGWFRSGDLGFLDEEGFLTLVDRRKDLIITGGENVYSAEVEDALFAHPSVAEAAVIGVPDEKWGESVRAIVVRRPGAEVSVEALIEHCRGRLARYKAPRSVVFVDVLPRNASGKVVKPELRRRFGEPSAPIGSGTPLPAPSG